MYVYNPRQKSSFSSSKSTKPRNEARAFSFGKVLSKAAPRRKQFNGSKTNLNILSFFSNTLVMQIFVLGIVTISLLLSFQSLTDVSTTSASAASNSEIRVYNNFQQKPVSTQRDQNRFIQGVPQQPVQTEAQSEPTSQTNQNLYTIKTGDTLDAIATKFETTASKISSLNNLNQDYSVEAGDVIKVRE